MNDIYKIAGKKNMRRDVRIVSLLILAAITSISGAAMTIPDSAYAAVSHRQNCVSIGGDGGDGGYTKRNEVEGGNGGKGNGGEGGNGGNDDGGDGGKGGKGGHGGDGGDASADGGDGGDGGKSRLACIIVDPDLTVKPTIVVPAEAFEPHPYR